MKSLFLSLLVGLSFGMSAFAEARASTSLTCNYDWDFAHEFQIIINGGAPVGADSSQENVEVGFTHPSRAIYNPVQFKPEIMTYLSLHTRLGIETSYSIKFKNGDELYVSERDNYDGEKSEGLSGFFSPKDGQSENIHCTVAP